MFRDIGMSLRNESIAGVSFTVLNKEQMFMVFETMYAVL